MHNFKKAMASVVLGGVCALSLTMTACAPDEPETEPHEHTYSTEWVFNSTQHWHPASCDDTNSVSEQADHVDENGDSVCDVCGFNYTHTHVFDDEWSADETNHWHAALCGHEDTADSAAHTANAAGVCTVCGYQVFPASEADVSTMEKALEVAELQSYRGEHAEGTIEYFNAIYNRTSTYTFNYDIYEDYTYVYYNGGYSITENWYSLKGDGSVFAIVDNNEGNGPEFDNTAYPVEAMDGYAFDNFTGTEQTYYGVTGLVTGLYDFATENDLLVDDSVAVPGEDSEYYTFALTRYEEGYSMTASGEEERDQSMDYYYEIGVQFTMDVQNYIDSVTVTTAQYDFDSMTFTDETGHGTLNEDAAPYIEYTYELTQGGRNPYVYDEIVMDAFDIADAEGNIISTDDPDAEVTVSQAPGSYINYSLTNIVPETADPTLDGLTVTLEKYNEEAAAYEPCEMGWMTVNVYTYSGTSVSINPSASASAEGEYRITFESENVTKYIILEVVYPAPTSIAAQANGNSVDSYNTYTGVNVAISGSVAYGYATGYEVEITSANAADATLSGDSTLGYTFSSNTAGTYTLTVTSTAAEGVSDTIDIVVSPAPAIGDILNGNYVYDIANDYTGNFEQNIYIGFTPASEGALSGTFSYYVITAWYGSFIGSCEYSYDETTGVITLSGLPEDMEATLTVAIADNYTPEVSLTVESYYGSETITASDLAVTTEEVPDEIQIDIPSEIEYMTYYNSTLDIGIYFEEGGIGSLFEGTDQWFTDIVVSFTWVVDENDHIVMTLADGETVPAELAEYVDLVFSAEGATYDATNASIDIGEYEFAEPSNPWGW